ncbi:MAG: Rieske 2Fe-2S domain-containing protein [Anaerolineae bacterium]
MKGWTRRRFVGALSVAGATWVVAACGQQGTQTVSPSSDGETSNSELDALQPGQGAILTLEGAKVAAYKDAQGTVIRLSLKCPHQGCDVAWNAEEKTWDCPCHESRFEPDGTLREGPAKVGMEHLG